jgi:transposase
MIPEPNHFPSEKAVLEIRGRTRRKFSTEEKILIVLEVPLGEVSIAELCRREEGSRHV